MTFLGYPFLKLALFAESVLYLAIPLRKLSHDYVEFWRAVPIRFEQQYCLTEPEIYAPDTVLSGVLRFDAGRPYDLKPATVPI